MGYDVSFHPISPKEMQEWYFTPLTWIQQGQEEKVFALAVQHGMEDFYAEKYLDTLRVGAKTEPDELFDKSHGFYIAVIQGFFRDYYYTRGSSFSLLVEQKPKYARYIITAKEGWDIDFVKYSIEIALSHLKKISQGSQTKFLTMGMLEDFVLNDYPFEKQKAIIASLKKIDEKIELNSKINDNLANYSAIVA